MIASAAPRDRIGSTKRNLSPASALLADPNLWGDLPAFGFYVRHAQGVTFTSCTTTAAHPDARKWLVASDVAKLETQ